MRTASRLAAALLVALTAACADPPEPLQVDGSSITVLNQTPHDWKNVLIVVNDHFRGGAPLLRADGRLNAPINQFETGFGQRWRSGTRIATVVVTATDANGEPVKLEWDVNQPRTRR